MQKFTLKDIQILVDKYKLGQSEDPLDRGIKADSDQLLAAVRQGDVEAILSHPYMSIGRDYVDRQGPDRMKVMEYTVIINITTCMHAAIDGGLPLQEAMDIADTLYHAMAKYYTDLDAAIDLFKIVPVYFAQRVHAQHVDESYLIERIKQFVCKNIFKKITLTQIAQHVALNPSYVSRLFSGQTGETLHDYIQRMKIESSCNMLLYSGRSISDIAQYYSFQSQSNYAKIFKKWKGISPSTYRNLHAKPDFFEQY